MVYLCINNKQQKGNTKVMKIVKLKGGLGNQMFQYAFALLLKKLTNDDVKLDFTSYSNNNNDPIRKPRILNFNIKLPIADQKDISKICKIPHCGDIRTLRYKICIILEVLLNKKYFFEKNRAYIAPYKILYKSYFDGYWQSWRYVEEVWNELKNDFTVKKVLDKSTYNFIQKVQAENSVFVGIRKGDYSSNISHYGCFTTNYYHKAMNYIQEKIPNAIFYIFSNDIQWVKNNMDFSNYKIEYRNNEQIVDDFEELLIMMNCKHSIIVNSTYHWWGAKMNDNPQKIVIAPQKWFFDNKPIDITPNNWILMSE